jgi:hypothetical protein
MESLSRSSGPEDRHAGLGCAYILDGAIAVAFVEGCPAGFILQSAASRALPCR